MIKYRIQKSIFWYLISKNWFKYRVNDYIGKTAVFISDENTRVFMSPRERFVYVRSIDDIFGSKFSGVIKLDDFWWINTDKEDAYHLLKQRQPELFEDR